MLKFYTMAMSLIYFALAFNVSAEDAPTNTLCPDKPEINEFQVNAHKLKTITINYH